MNRSLDVHVGAPPGRWDWLVLTNQTTPVGLYRIVVGLAVTLHFVTRAAVAASIEHSWRGAALGAACAALGALITCGAATSAAAVALNVLAVVVYKTTPAPTLDDYAANVVSIVVLLSATQPAAQRLTQHSATGLGLLVVCATVIGVYIGGGPFAFFADSGQGPAWIRWTFRAAAVLLVAPSQAFRAGGVVVQVCLHGYLFAAGPYRLAHVVFGASALLFMSLRSASNRRFVVDAATILGMSALAIAGAAYGGARFFGQDVSRSARVLAAVGLLPFPSQKSAPERTR